VGIFEDLRVPIFRLPFDFIHYWMVPLDSQDLVR
jgi:hypothetical protein